MKTRYEGSSLEEMLEKAAAEFGCSVEELSYYDLQDENQPFSAVIFSSGDVKEFLFDYLGDFFMGIDQDLEVSIEEKNGQYVVRMNAENNAVLIGKMGKTLAAFNTVVRAAVNAEFHKRIDVLIDVNNYKEDRYAKLSAMAKRIGRQVIKSHVDAVLDPMPNDERKIIHQILSDWKNLQTQSEGDGAGRHICIRYVADKEETE